MPGGVELRDDPAVHGWPGLPVVAVVRSHAAGLVAAQEFAARQAERPTVALHGLVIVADAPGRLPRNLNATIRLISGGYPRTWLLPWVEAWRQGQPVTPTTIPNPYRSLLADLMTRTGMSPAQTGD